VFQYGFKAVPVKDVPYVLWLVAGIIPWFYFSDALTGATNALLEYTYLVKKVVFKIDVLPMVKIASSIFIHLFFILIGVIMYVFDGIGLGIYSIQIIYYTLCTTLLVIGLSYFTSAVVVFFRDLGQIVNVILQFGMWLTPIMWQIDILPPKLQTIMKLNPMYYITDGYRDAFYTGNWFWEKPVQTVYFWVLVFVIFVVGTHMYKKLEKHFADVL
jgi:teichoic acid transport system permease protein